MKKNKIIIILLTLVLLLSGCVVTPVENDTETKVEDKEGKEEEKLEEEKEELPVEDVELNFGEKAKISPDEVKNIYGDDIEMLLRFNDFTGKKAPDFKMTSIEGESFSLSDYEGEDVIIEFMASWCPACLNTTEKNDKFNDSNDTKLIGIGINDDTESLKQLIEENNLTSTEYFVPEDGIMEKYDVLFVPLYIFIDKEGYIQMMLAGDVPLEMIETYAVKSFN